MSGSKMYLPHYNNIYISSNKLKDYLLNPDHETGGSKAIYFRKIGFSEINIQEFSRQLMLIPQLNEISKVVQNHFGTKFIIEGNLDVTGKTYPITTVWFIENQSEIPN